MYLIQLQGVKLIFLATNFQDLVAKVKKLVAVAPVLGAISRPELDNFVSSYLKRNFTVKYKFTLKRRYPGYKLL